MPPEINILAFGTFATPMDEVNDFNVQTDHECCVKFQYIKADDYLTGQWIDVTNVCGDYTTSHMATVETPLEANTQYHWRAKIVDWCGVEGEWSAIISIETNAEGYVPNARVCW
jgi:hypothetical protein